MTRIVAITQKKGGVGKTTTVSSIAAIAAQRGLDVGVIDLDSQGTATTGFGADLADTAADVLLGRLPLDDAWTPTAAGVRVIASGPGTEGAEKLLAADPVEGLLALRRAIESSASPPGLILIDTRPDEAHAVLNAYVAAHEVWIVTEPVPASIEVIPRLVSTVKRIAGTLNPGLQVTAIIPTKVDARTKVHAGGIAALTAAFGGIVTARVPVSVRAVEAHGARMPLPLYAPNSPAAAAYRAIADQLLRVKVAA
jgi:chromosome partitioning protein